jgi:hypothetical protein
MILIIALGILLAIVIIRTAFIWFPLMIILIATSVLVISCVALQG